MSMARRGVKRSRSTRHNKRKRSRLSKYSVARAVNPDRKFIREYRRDPINSPAGKTTWGVVADMDCVSDHSYIISTTGAGGLPLGSNVSNSKQDYVIKNNRNIINMRNVSNHDCFLTLYEVQFRQDYFKPGTTGVGTFATCIQYALAHLVYGWDVVLPDAAIIPASGLGSVVDYVDGDTSFTSVSEALTPFKSSNFCKAFKILKANKIKLRPGDDVRYVLRGSKTVYNDQVRKLYSSLNSGAHHQLGYANKTKLLIYKLHGALGKSNTDDSVIGWMDTDVAVEKMWTADVVPMQVGTEQRLTSITVTQDDIAAHSLEGPTEFEVKDDNQ